MENKKRDIDILCIGEVLIDFIGHQTEVTIDDTRDYHRYLGGSPTNVAMNSSRLGLNSYMVATVGDDGFGTYIHKRFSEVGVNTSLVKTTLNDPTSVIFVSRSDSTPDFLPFRAADFQISPEQVPTEILYRTKIFHTTCFALSKNPAQTTILKKAEEAFNLGCKLSIDLNYSEKMWANKTEANKIIASYCELNPLLKISEDDMFRFFNKTLNHHEIFNYFHKLGVETICLTLGSKGVKLARKEKTTIKLPAIKIDNVMDATGAGDAFWSGFLFAYVQNKPIEDCLQIALKLAALKLQNVGRLPDNINILSKLL
ncbi:carbohydrate kinase family protein [Psychroserpens sp. XS_ASV72]|uniref:carbohydrate kinase family protein n=1 Tax=Psychroserpens sp. XS_ASV72 TaxID=3241293 RepID=UPI003512F67E